MGQLGSISLVFHLFVLVVGKVYIYVRSKLTR